VYIGHMFNGCEQLNLPYADVKYHLRNLPKRSYYNQNHTQLLQSLWERIKPLLKNTTKLNGYFKRYTISEPIKAPIKESNHKSILPDLPSDWQDIELPQWNP
jgi:hypothetical protein